MQNKPNLKNKTSFLGQKQGNLNLKPKNKPKTNPIIQGIKTGFLFGEMGGLMVEQVYKTDVIYLFYKTLSSDAWLKTSRMLAYKFSNANLKNTGGIK